MLLHPAQRRVVESPARFKVIRAGRRSGKTSVEIEVMLFKAVTGKDRRVYYLAPTQKQAREIIWESFKTRVAGIAKLNEQRLEISVPTTDGGTSLIQIAGWENRENFRGKPAHHITFDETDTMKDFFIGWQEIFRPTLVDTKGTADFIGTPKKENPNLRRLEKEFESKGEDFAAFHFTTADNPHIDPLEIAAAQRDSDVTTFKQEYLAEYVENAGALFRYTSLIDLFSNSVVKNQKYLTVDIADDGSDKTIFTLWHGLEAYDIQLYSQLQTDGIVNQIRETAAKHQVPYSQIAVDAIGVGAGVASSPLLTGIIGFKSSYGALRVEKSIVSLPNVHYLKHAPLVTDYKNLRSQCIFTLASLVNDHKVAVRTEDVRIRSQIIEELSNYQDVSQGDGKRMATMKEDIKEIIGRSPDITDTFIMRMYFELTSKLLPDQSEHGQQIIESLDAQFARNIARSGQNSTK